MRLSQRLLMEEAPKTALSDIFEEEPVPLDVFVTDHKFLNNPPLSPIQHDLVKHIERIYLPELYPLMAQEFGGYWSEQVRMTNLITAMWGKGSGKDSSVRVAALRVAYLLMCLKSPLDYFGLPHQDSIHILNIAANSQQANRAFFAPMTRAVKHGWFADRADPKRDTIEFDKNIEAISGHSDAESQEGLNIILGVADEIDAFRTKTEMKSTTGARMREASTSAETILDMLKTSASSRFPPNYKRVAISYPRYLGSKIMLLTDEAKKDVSEFGDDSIYYASGPYATWEVNPRIKGKEAFASDYRTDPKGAAAKYECKPTRAIKPYFQHPEFFKSAVDRDTQPITIDYELRKYFVEQTGRTVEMWEPVFTLREDFKPIQGARYVIHGDLAIVSDRAGIAMSHVSGYFEREETVKDSEGGEYRRTYKVPNVKNDFVIYFEATKEVTPAREIQIRWVRELVFMLRNRGFNIAQVSHDGFQSTDTLQILNTYGINTTVRSTDRKPEIWKTLKDVATEGRLSIPYSSLLLNELESLSEVGGGKVDHPVNGSKDLADALACSVMGALEIGGQEDSTGAVVPVDRPNRFTSGQDSDGFSSSAFGFATSIPTDLSAGAPIGMEEYH